MNNKNNRNFQRSLMYYQGILVGVIIRRKMRSNLELIVLLKPKILFCISHYKQVFAKYLYINVISCQHTYTKNNYQFHKYIIILGT